jgi:hypothetical protein
MHGSFTPVRLVALQRDWKYTKAAFYLLDQYGLSKPRHFRERFDELVVRQAQGEQVSSPAYLVEALQIALKSNPMYLQQQYDAEVVETWDEVLTDLDELIARRVSEDQVRAWYGTAKLRLLAVVDTGTLST